MTRKYKWPLSLPTELPRPVLQRSASVNMYRVADEILDVALVTRVKKYGSSVFIPVLVRCNVAHLIGLIGAVGEMIHLKEK